MDLVTGTLLTVNQGELQENQEMLGGVQHPLSSNASRASAKVEDFPVSENEASGKPQERTTSSSPPPIYPEPWKDGARVYMDRPTSDSWATLQKLVEKHDKEMCEGWKDDLDTMLVFTGLFSAAVTAFCVESFNSLSQNPADTTNALLLLISQQLSNSSTGPTSSDFTPAKPDVQINVLYFVSLALALSVSSVCILAKQWIREFRRDVAVSAHDALRVRQARYDGLIAWKVPQILAALPVILQAALLLFFGGLLVQLWNVSDLTPAIAVTVIVLVLLSVVVFTTIVPGQRETHDDPYERFTPFRSPQAWIFLFAWQRIRLLVINTSHSFRFSSYAVPERHIVLSSWAHFDTNFLTDENTLVQKSVFRTGPEYLVTSTHRTLRWIYEVLRSAHEVEQSLFWCINDPPRDLLPSTLAHYVRKESDPPAVTSELTCYQLDCEMRAYECLDSARGRAQVEMLIRGGNQIAASGKRNADSSWSFIFRALRLHHGILDRYTEPDIRRHQETVIIQIALFFENLFDLWTRDPLTLPVSWHRIFDLLFDVRSVKSPRIVALTEDIFTNAFPKTFRNIRSWDILVDVAWAIQRQVYSDETLSYGMRLFMALDAIVVRWCSEAQNLDSKGLERWGARRMRMREISSHFGRVLPVDHFDVVNGPLVREVVKERRANPEHEVVTPMSDSALEVEADTTLR